MAWFLSVLRNGKTIVGAIITVASSIGAALSPDDVALLQAILHGSHTAGQVVLAIGLLDKLRKAALGRQEVVVPNSK